MKYSESIHALFVYSVESVEMCKVSFGLVWSCFISFPEAWLWELLPQDRGLQSCLGWKNLEDVQFALAKIRTCVKTSARFYRWQCC